MIFKESYLQVADNSGAKLVKCIKILGAHARSKYAQVGDYILVSVVKLNKVKNFQKSKKSDLVKKGEIFKALIIRTKKTKSNLGSVYYGQRVSFQENSVVLMNQENLIGSRIFGPINRKIKAKNLNKLISQSQGLL